MVEGLASMSSGWRRSGSGQRGDGERLRRTRVSCERRLERWRKHVSFRRRERAELKRRDHPSTRRRVPIDEDAKKEGQRA
jgi:hypothetical protein